MDHPLKQIWHLASDKKDMWTVPWYHCHNHNKESHNMTILFPAVHSVRSEWSTFRTNNRSGALRPYLIPSKFIYDSSELICCMIMEDSCRNETHLKSQDRQQKHWWMIDWSEGWFDISFMQLIISCVFAFIFHFSFLKTENSVGEEVVVVQVQVRSSGLLKLHPHESKYQIRDFFRNVDNVPHPKLLSSLISLDLSHNWEFWDWFRKLINSF